MCRCMSACVRLVDSSEARKHDDDATQQSGQVEFVFMQDVYAMFMPDEDVYAMFMPDVYARCICEGRVGIWNAILLRTHVPR